MDPDLKIVIGEHYFPVHRCLLSHRSKYFTSLLSGKYKEAGQQQVRISEVNPDVFEELLNIIYDRPYESSPALMSQVQFFGVNVDLDMLHGQFDVPEEQFDDYLNAIMTIYSGKLSEKAIERVAYNMPKGMDIFKLPKSIQESVLMALDNTYLRTRWDTMAQYLRMKSKEHESKGEKSKEHESKEWKIYKFFDEDNSYQLRDVYDNEIEFSDELQIKALSVYDAFLKLRAYLNRLNFLHKKEDITNGYDESKHDKLQREYATYHPLAQPKEQRTIPFTASEIVIARSPHPPRGYVYSPSGQLIDDDPVLYYMTSRIPDIFSEIQRMYDDDVARGFVEEVQYDELDVENLKRYEKEIDAIINVILGEVTII